MNLLVNNLTNQYKNEPLKIGQIFARAPIGPRLVYCPAVISMKSKGSPQSSSMMPYGIKKAPPPDL
jgi:hypothetical protein